MIEAYIESKKYAWSETTKRSELYRLRAVQNYLTGDPLQLWENIQNQKPYARLTTWTRVTQYWEYLLSKGLQNGQNPYKEWRITNARLFKNVYEKRQPAISFQDAKSRIEGLCNLAIKRRALEILSSGTRYCETENRPDGSSVIGKGSKRRIIFQQIIAGPDYKGSYSHFWRELKRIGLRPHDLRKIFLTRLVELGANPFELAEIAGWSSIETAQSYIKVNDNSLKRLVSRI